jgi:hypothetical protein
MILRFASELIVNKLPRARLGGALQPLLDAFPGAETRVRLDSAVRNLYQEQPIAMLLNLVRRRLTNAAPSLAGTINDACDALQAELIDQFADVSTGMLAVIPRTDKLTHLRFLPSSGAPEPPELPRTAPAPEESLGGALSLEGMLRRPVTRQRENPRRIRAPHSDNGDYS